MAKRASKSAKATEASSNAASSPADPAPATPVIPPVLDGVVADDGLTVTQRHAITLLAGGRSIKVTAKRVGVHRNTVHRWLRGDPAFRAAYSAWIAEVQESAHARLLSLVDPAVTTLGHAIHKRNLGASLALLKGLNVFTPPAAGPEDPEECRRWTKMERMERQATLLENENLAYKRRSNAGGNMGRPYGLQIEDREREAALEKQEANPVPESATKNENPSANPPSQKEVEALMRELDEEDLAEDEDLEDEEDLEEDEDLGDDDLDEEDADEDE